MKPVHKFEQIKSNEIVLKFITKHKSKVHIKKQFCQKKCFFDLGLSLANPLRVTSLFKKIITITRKATPLDRDERMMPILENGLLQDVNHL